MNVPTSLSTSQQISLVLLRTLIGWHFLYEGFSKLWQPAWSRGGSPLPPWSSAGYLRAASGPFARFFHHLADSPWLPTVDSLIAVGLFLVGLSLILGLFTGTGCLGALAFLSLFYLSSIPTHGIHEAGGEGAYLFVNKNLVEAGGVLVLLAFPTGRLAGLDHLRGGRANPRLAKEASS